MIDALYTAQSGLFTSRYAIETTSNNIANENTEGYKKRVSEISELSSLEDNIGNGVSFDDVSRTTNQYLYNQILTQVSQEEYYSQEDEILSQMEVLFSETDTSGLSVTISDYFESIENLRSNPNSDIYKTNLETQSESLIIGLQSLYNDVEDLKENISTQLNDDVEEVNKLLEQIVYINQEIQDNGESNDLLDKRDQLELELTSYGDIEVNTDNDNYQLKVGGVTTIFNNTNLHEITVMEDGDSSYLAVYEKEINLSSGSLNSLVNNLDEDISPISSALQSLDDFANALITEVNANSTSDLFSGDSVSNISFNSSSLNDLTNDDLENLAQIQWSDDINIDSTTSETSSFSDFYQALRVDISSQVESNAFLLDAQETVVQSLQTTYNNQTKVDTDEEMINLIEYQAAYEANAKVITVVDEMLQTILNM